MKTILSLRGAVFFSVVLVISLFILSAPSYAQTIVTNLDDSGPGSLRDAIEEANITPGPNEIVFDAVLMGTILLSTGEMGITDALTITGPGAGVITIDANMMSRIFFIDGLASDIVISISGLRFINGSANGGGAIRNFEELSIDSCVFEENSANFGGAIWNDATIEEITNSTFSGNGADSSGGAIRNGGTITAITNSTFTGNRTLNAGGAIMNEGDPIIEKITNSTFSGNHAFFSGGAIRNIGTITEITNSTFSGNSTLNAGGAIASNGTINISFTTIAGNTAGDSWGDLVIFSGSIRLRNTILADNTPVNCGGGSPLDNEGNYSDDGTCGFTGPSSMINASINLGPLADNGGPTQTMELEGGDPVDGATMACDPLDSMGMASGVALSVDQRFFPRPFPAGGECDAGAFEAQPIGMFTIEKLTNPPGGMNFEFLGTGFPKECGLMDTFFLDDTEINTCILPAGIYTVDEIIQPGNLPIITCNEPPVAQTFEGVTMDIGDGDDIICTFTNEPAVEVIIKKLTIPPGGTGFMFTSTGFTGLPNCDITDAFTLDNLQTASCFVPPDIYTITEEVPADQVLNIFCEELPATFNIDPLTGTLEFAINSLDDSVDCLFINSPANTVVRISDEPPGMNCEFGGEKIETGLDTNQDGMLDPGEPIIDTNFICNGPPGPEGPEGPEGPSPEIQVSPEPPGPNCPDGGVKIETGIDANENGSLEEDEITDTTYYATERGEMKDL